MTEASLQQALERQRDSSNERAESEELDLIVYVLQSGLGLGVWFRVEHRDSTLVVKKTFSMELPSRLTTRRSFIWDVCQRERR